MKKVLLTTVILLTYFTNLYSQNEANNWYFGNRAGLTFNTVPPSPLTNGVLNTSEGCATLSDAAGNLLFYTDGINVWNRNHILMPNGTGLMGDPSAAQSAIVIPKPGSRTNFYIITVPETGSVGMRYSEVDISLNGGLGDILTTNKNTLLFAPSSEKVTAVKHANGVYYWVIGRQNSSSNIYRAFLIDCNGINTTPVTSAVGTTGGENWGYLVASPDATRLASASSGSGVELTSFDPSTGVVSNPIFLGSLSYSGHTGGNYGVAFSPNGNVLYASSITNWAVVQWDLTAANIPASQLYLGDAAGNGATRPSYRGGALQLGPDGKIYVAHVGTPALGVIHSPNTIGTGCNLQNNAINLSARNCVLGLPPFIQSYFSDNLDINYSNICEGETTSFSFSGGNYLDSIHWNFGDAASPNNFSNLSTPSHSYPAAGTYTVRLIKYLDCISDTTYKQVTIHAPVRSQQQIILCSANTYQLPDGIVVSAPGTYTSTLTSTITGCDSIVTTAILAPQTSFSAGNDQSICRGQVAQLQAGAALNYAWTPSTGLSSTSIANPVATPSSTTEYIVSSQVQVSNNLIVNGDFENGNTGFSTGYLFSQPNPLGGPGHYTISTAVTNSWWPNCTDHTSGNGNMLIADGANGSNGVSAGTSIWCQTISVAPNTDYAFSAWLTNLNSQGATSQLGFYINGTQIGQPQNTPIGVCQWNQFYVIWNSGNATSAQVCISEMSGAQPGNDYALDDISFYQICTVTDTVTVNVSDIQLTTSSITHVDCFGNNTGAVTTDAQGGVAPYSYTWSNSQTTADLHSLPAGTYTLDVRDNIGCTKNLNVVVNQPPVLTASAVSNNIIECEVTNTGSATVTIGGGTPAYMVTWDNQETTTTAQSLSPGNHTVTITDANNCTANAQVSIEYKAPPTLQINTTNVCKDVVSSFTSQASIAAPETITNYQWNIVKQGSSYNEQSTQSNPSLTLNEAGNYTATLTVTSSNGCTVEKSITFEIYNNPVAAFDYQNKCFQVSDFLNLSTHPDNKPLTFQWDIHNDQSVEYVTRDFSQYFDDPHSFALRLKATDPQGCSNEKVQQIDILEGKPEIEFPNVIHLKSLVGNDKFNLNQIVPNFNLCLNYTLTVMNRWGSPVFSVTNTISSPDLDCSYCFTGRTNNGSELTEGVYFYTLKGDYGLDKSGFITVLTK